MAQDPIKQYEDAKERLREWSMELFRYLPTIASLAAALLVVATFNPQLIPINTFTRLLISVLLVIIPVSFWLGFLEFHKVVEYSKEHLFDVVEEAHPDNPVVKKLKSDLTQKSPIRVAQFILAILLTLVIGAVIILIWCNHPGTSPTPIELHRHVRFLL